MADFASIIKQLRIDRNIKQKDIAEYLGVLPRNIRFYESGDKLPTIQGLVKLADFFNVPIDYLVGRTDDMDTAVYAIQTKAILSDNRPSLDTKCLYLQFCHLAIQGKVQIFNGDEFCKEYGISRKEFDEIIKELADLGYLRIDKEADESSGGVYVLEENSVALENIHMKDGETK